MFFFPEKYLILKNKFWGPRRETPIFISTSPSTQDRNETASIRTPATPSKWLRLSTLMCMTDDSQTRSTDLHGSFSIIAHVKIYLLACTLVESLSCLTINHIF